MEGQVTLSSCTCSEARQCFIPHLGLAPHLPQPIKSNVSVIWAQFRSQPFSWQRGKPREREVSALALQRALLSTFAGDCYGNEDPHRKWRLPCSTTCCNPTVRGQLSRLRSGYEPGAGASAGKDDVLPGGGWPPAGREGGRLGPSRAPPLRLKGSQLPARPPVGARRRRE